MKRLNWLSGLFAVAAVTAFAATSAQAQTAPDALIKTVATDVTTVLKADPAILGNAAKLKELIENKLIPNFSFARTRTSATIPSTFARCACSLPKPT